MTYRFHLITGPMRCGKSDLLIRHIVRSSLAGKNVLVVKPTLDTRDYGYIKSRSGLQTDAIKIEKSEEILEMYKDIEFERLFIDEIQFLDDEIVNIIQYFMKKDILIVASGLDLDFKSEPFGPMSHLLAIADKVEKLTSICVSCGSEHAIRTQRLINGFPATKDSPLIMVGDENYYEPRCLECYILPI